MTADLTREQAREQIARELYVVAHVGVLASPAADDILRRTWAKNAHRDSITGSHRAAADAALTVLWPVVERLTRERDEARENGVVAVALVERMAAAEGYYVGFMAGFAESGEGFNGELDSDRGNTADADQAWLNHGGPDLSHHATASDAREVEARDYAFYAEESLALAEAPFVAVEKLHAEVERLTAELAHAHAVIARHVEPRRGPDSTPGAPPAVEPAPPRVPGQGGGEHA